MAKKLESTKVSPVKESGLNLITNIPTYSSFESSNFEKFELECTVWRSAFLLIRHSKYSAKLSKIHFYRLLFLWFCPLLLCYPLSATWDVYPFQTIKLQEGVAWNRFHLSGVAKPPRMFFLLFFLRLFWKFLRFSWEKYRKNFKTS